MEQQHRHSHELMGSRIPAYPAIDCIEQGYAQPRSPMSCWAELLRRRSAAAAHSSESEAVALLPPWQRTASWYHWQCCLSRTSAGHGHTRGVRSGPASASVHRCRSRLREPPPSACYADRPSSFAASETCPKGVSQEWASLFLVMRGRLLLEPPCLLCSTAS